MKTNEYNQGESDKTFNGLKEYKQLLRQEEIDKFARVIVEVFLWKHEQELRKKHPERYLDAEKGE